VVYETKNHINSYTLHYPNPTQNDERLLEIYRKLLNEKEQQITGYYTLPKESKTLAAKLHKGMFEPFDRIAIIGIGGSSLGTKAIYSFLKDKRTHLPIHFLENPDPIALRTTFERLEKERTLFLVISKSGTTIETIAIFKAVLKHFDLDLARDTRRIGVITDKDSALHKFANRFGITSFMIPQNVGGRFSVLSNVGIVPLTLAGFDTIKILQGADRFIESFFNFNEKHVLQKALFIARNWQIYRMNVLFSYANELEDFNKWYVQLWGESLGKKNPNGNNVGPTPVAHIGPVDQHSFLQLIMEGPKDKTVTFLCVEDFEEPLTIPDISLPYLEKTDFLNDTPFGKLVHEECQATLSAINSLNIPTDQIALPNFCEVGIGELIIYYELLTSSVGAILQVDTYTQPGVELGKKILKKRFI